VAGQDHDPWGHGGGIRLRPADCRPEVDIWPHRKSRSSRLHEALLRGHPESFHRPPPDRDHISLQGLARRKPMLLLSFDGSFELLLEDDTLNALLFQLPPRSPRDEPVIPPPSLHPGPPAWRPLAPPCGGGPAGRPEVVRCGRARRGPPNSSRSPSRPRASCGGFAPQQVARASGGGSFSGSFLGAECHRRQRL
jgi:hypothetical protein